MGFNPLAWFILTLRTRRDIRQVLTTGEVGAGAPRCLIVLSPWLDTSIPFYTLAIGLMLSRRGATVSFIVDDIQFDPHRVRHAFVLTMLRWAMALARRRFPVLWLSKIGPLEGYPTQEAIAEIGTLARLNAVWALRGEIVEDGRQEFEQRSARQIGAAYGCIAAVFATETFDMMFVPGGVYGTSGVWTSRARAVGVRVATFDAGSSSVVLIASSGIAAQLQDVPRAFATIRERCNQFPAEAKIALQSAAEEMAKRKGGTDKFNSQIADAGMGGTAYDGAVLIALNSSWDSAALGPHAVFTGNTPWIVETVRHLLDHSDAPVLVRQHPVERMSFARTSDDYRALMETHFPGNPRVHFIAADDPVNTYFLLDRVKAVVVHTSTIGVEAASWGCPVVTPSKSYYAQLGFVWQATDLAEYQLLLEKAARGELQVTPAMQRDARICYYTTQSCNWVLTKFNPAECAFWSKFDLAHWEDTPAVKIVLESLSTGIPVAVLNHRMHCHTVELS